MSITKQIVCLANSRKNSGRCIAGKELTNPTGVWIRPVSARETEEVSLDESQYQDGTYPCALDVIEIVFQEHRPKNYQQENWLFDPGYYWDRAGQVLWDDLANLEDHCASLWVNGQSTYHGLNDQLPLHQANSLTDSLKLIRVNSLQLEVCAPGAAFGNPKRRVLGQFQHAGSDYLLWVTDVDIEKKYLAFGDGRYDVGECFLTISLGEPFNGYCYKLIAAVIERP